MLGLEPSLCALALCGLAGNGAGFLLALALNQSPGPVLVLTAGSLTLLTYVFGSNR